MNLLPTVSRRELLQVNTNQEHNERVLAYISSGGEQTYRQFLELLQAIDQTKLHAVLSEALQGEWMPIV